MTRPQRIQRRRTTGWRMPDDAIYVGRPSIYGNPFPVDDDGATWRAVALGYMGHAAGRRAAAVALHRAWLTGEPVGEGPLADPRSRSLGALEFPDGHAVSLDEHCRGIAAAAAGLTGPLALPARPDLSPLRGHDLVCWCPPDLACHADVLLALANGPAL